MMKPLKLLLFSITLMMSILLFSATAQAAGNTMSTATAISLSQEITGELVTGNTVDYYKVELPSSGIFAVRGSISLPALKFTLYDSTGAIMSSSTFYEADSLNYTYINLIGGTYYLCFRQAGAGSGEYDFEAVLASANESFPETLSNNDNYFNAANKISLNKAYRGQLAVNDDIDTYEFTLASSGEIHFVATCKMGQNSYILYDSRGNQVIRYDVSMDYEGNTTLDEEVDLIQGNYYLQVTNGGYSTGPYAFKLSFTSAEETYPETGANNTMTFADAIPLGQIITGQLATNDSIDYYVFNLPIASNVTFTLTGGMRYIYMDIYSSAGTRYFHANPEWDSSSTGIFFETTRSLAAGNYYVGITVDGVWTGPYTLLVEPDFELTPTPTPIPVATATPTPSVTYAPSSPKLYINQSSVVLYSGKVDTEFAQTTLKTRLRSLTGTVKFKSANKSIAKVSSKGVITAVKKGQTTITAYVKTDSKTYKKTCKVTVKEPIFYLRNSSITLSVGEEYSIHPFALPQSSVTYQSQNKAVAQVDEDGVITGVSEGTAYLHVSCNGFTKKVKVIVEN